MYLNQSDGTMSRKFVKLMAKKFEQISSDSTSYISSHEANFKQCNWWLDMPASVTCFDDLGHDPQAPANENNEQYVADAEATTRPIAFETAEVASELDNIVQRRSADDSDNADFFQQINQCIRFPTPSNQENEKTSTSTFTFRFDRPSDMGSDAEPNEEVISSMPVIVPPVLGDRNTWPISLTSTTSQTSTSSSSASSHSPSSRTSRTSQTSFNSMSSVSSGQITNTVEELLYNEETYIRSLNYGIDGYMKHFNRKGMPPVLRGQQYRIFGNVHRIKDFHESIFFPALRQCNMDIVKICNTFCDFIEKDYFYIYISYAINRKKSEKMCIAQSAYFKQIQDEIGDKLGVNSFLVQPIQRLPKYRLLLGQLFSELGKRFGVHDDSIKNELGACCLAEKRIQRLLNILDGSVEISDILDCELHTLCQGKFMLVDRFEICEKSDLRRRYKGKLFLFEKCIIYTELLSKNKLQYRGHFRHVTLGFTFEDQRNYFRLYNERKGNQEIEFSADAQTIALWIQMLNRTMAAVVQQEKKKIKENSRSSMKSELSPLQVLLRTTTPILRDIAVATIQSEGTDTSSSPSNRNTGDYSNAETVSIKSGRSLDSQSIKQTTWYTEFDNERRLIERFQNSEKFYIQLLKNAITTYLTDFPDDLRTVLNTFLDAIKRIAKFHADTFHPMLIQCEMKTITICDLIKTHLDHLEFNIYFKYAAYVHEALQMIRDFHLNSEHHLNQMSDDASDEITTLLQMPINHITNYAQFLDGLLNEYKTRNLLGSEFRTIAAVEIEMKKLHKLVMENYTLNSMKGSACLARKFGIITYSDEISIDFTKCRIMILEVGLVCVRTRLSTKTKKEKFVDQLFSIPIFNIELHENDAYPRKMKIIADNATHVNYTVTFSTTRKKKQFMEAIRTQRNAPGLK